MALLWNVLRKEETQKRPVDLLGATKGSSSVYFKTTKVRDPLWWCYFQADGDKLRLGVGVVYPMGGMRAPLCGLPFLTLQSMVGGFLPALPTAGGVVLFPSPAHGCRGGGWAALPSPALPMAPRGRSFLPALPCSGVGGVGVHLPSWLHQPSVCPAVCPACLSSHPSHQGQPRLLLPRCRPTDCTALLPCLQTVMVMCQVHESPGTALP